MSRQEFHINKLLRKGWSKLGVLGKLSDMNMRPKWHEVDKEQQLIEKINSIFNEILNEGEHVAQQLKGGSKSEFLRIKNKYEA